MYIYIHGSRFNQGIYIYSNPWFWAGGVVIALVFIFSNRFQNYMENSKSANFLNKKAEEKKSE